MPTVKSDNLNSVPRTHSVGGEDQFPQAIFNLWPAHACPTLTNTHTHMHTDIDTETHTQTQTNTEQKHI